MKKLILAIIVFLPMCTFAQNSKYNISSYFAEGIKAPNTHHIGDAWLNFLVEGDENFEYNITQATFSSNSTLDWHTSSAHSKVSYIAIYGSSPTEWTEKLTRE